MTEEDYRLSDAAERSVLGSIILDNLLYELAFSFITRYKMFRVKKHQKIWQAIEALLKENIEVSIITILAELKSLGLSFDLQAGYITDLTDELASENLVPYYAEIVMSSYISRQQIIHADKFKKGEITTEEFQKKLAFLNLLKPSIGNSIETILDNTTHDFKTGDNIVNFNWDILDKIQGGISRGGICTVAGKTGHGKTAFMIYSIKNFIEADNIVLLFNREMSNKQVMQKIITFESKALSYSNFRFKKLNELEEEEKEDYNKTVEKIKIKYNKLIMIDNIRTMKETIREIQIHKPDIVIDDYMQLIKTDQKDKRMEVMEVMHEYEWCAKKNNCAILLGSQVNRSNADRIEPIPMMTDLAEGATIEKISESVIMLFYGFRHSEETYPDQNKVTLSFQKSRYGQTNRKDIGFKGDRCLYYNLKE